ncbi:adenylate/guanylate cyclase domain-containing protein [soil metagenome]
MANERLQRRLAAVVAIDVVGYSRLMEQDEAGTLATLKDRRKNVLYPHLVKHQGRVIKFMGDGVLVEFGSAVNAVEYAVALQQGMADANKDTAHTRHIVLRVGICLGDVLVEGNDLYGEGVNIAARLEGLAEPGGILVSNSVYDFVKNKVDIGFDDVGPQTLKNIGVPVQAWRVRGASDTPSSGLNPAASKPSIAILPFTNMSGDTTQMYFSDGITEDIITELSRFRSLLVIARNSSFQYRDKAVDIRRVGRELGARYVLEGSVRKMANRVRITAQLIEAATGNHVWSERYDRNIDDLFEVQDEVTRTIVATLTGRLEDAEMKGAAHRRTENVSAYDILLHGIELLRGNSASDNRKARELFESAILLDPSFALAHAYLALALLVEHRYDNAPDAIKDRAVESALAAVRLDPGEGRCHQFLAQAYRFRGEYDLALTHFQRAAALNPNDANGIALMGSVLAIVGRPEEGIGLIRQAMQLNPFHPEWYWNQLAVALYAARRYEDALQANRQNSGQKQFWYLARMAACFAQLERLEEARAHANEVLRRKPDFRLSAVQLRYRNPADAEHVLEGMRKAGLPE